MTTTKQFIQEILSSASEHYETYHRLCDKYGSELVHEFVNNFDSDISCIVKFEDLYEGHYETGQDFAWHWVNEICEETKNIPSWVTIDYKDIWENKLSKDYFEIDCYNEHTYGHIFKREKK